MAVFPTILVNSSTGSDSLASGAGPSTAKTGTLAATDGVNGKTVTITDTVDLSGVATDGSAAIYIADATAGHRNFDQITAVAGGPSGSPWTVTVANGFSLSLSGQSWAIGGVRATLDATSTRKLFNNNSANGDAMPGWTIQLNSDQTITSPLTLFRSGSTTGGNILVTGNGTLRTITTTANSAVFTTASNLQLWKFSFIGHACSNASHTTAYGFSVTSGTTGPIRWESCSFGGASNQVLNGIARVGGGNNSNGEWSVRDCYFRTAGSGFVHGGGVSVVSVSSCLFDSCGADAISLTASGLAQASIRDNIFYNTTGNGIELNGVYQVQVFNNTFYLNSADGFDFSLNTLANSLAISAWNNIFANNGGYGAHSPVGFDAVKGFWDYNDYFSNTSGTTGNMTGGSHDLALDPQFTNAAGFNFSIGTNLKAKGYPVGGTTPIGGTGGSTYSYVDIGAAQRQEAGGGGTNPGFIIGG